MSSFQLYPYHVTMPSQTSALPATPQATSKLWLFVPSGLPFFFMIPKVSNIPLYDQTNIH